MSQSPLEPTAQANPTDGYLGAWDRLARRIQQGNSFSGRERNCVFLNTGTARFADASAASGLDFIDDGRAVAVTDWDGDGDLDLWLANRTGPRVRFARNDLARGGWVAFALEGDPGRGCNRDAVGARVTVEAGAATAAGEGAGGGDGGGETSAPGRWVKSLYAGDAYLSQSSKRLHFGLGPLPAGTPLRVAVRWPVAGSAEAATETFSGIIAGRLHRLAQGSGAAVSLPPRPPVALASSTPAVPPPEPAARVRLAHPLQLEPFSYQTLDGRTAEVARGPVLVNLWATWCAPCQRELKDLAAAEAKIIGAGLRVVALSVDGVDAGAGASGRPANAAAVKRHLEKLGFPFPAGLADAALVERLDGIQRGAIYRQQRLPLPASFLIDRLGRLAVVYKGPVDVGRLLRDVRTLDGDEAAARREAVPFPGRWIDELDERFQNHPVAVARVYLEGGYHSDARAYLERFLAEHPEDPGATGKEAQLQRFRLADVHHHVGLVAREEGDYLGAAEAFRRALRYNPRLFPAHLDLAAALSASGDHRAGLAVLQRLRTAHPGTPAMMTQMGAISEKLGRPADAAGHYRAALALESGWPPAANNLAWILATSPRDELRDGAEALRLAQAAAAATGNREPRYLDTLAAAQAEAGHFDRATTTAENALRIAREQGDTVLAPDLAQRLEAYRAGTPYRDRP